MIDSLFGSKTRVKLLHLFLNNPSKPFYVREITRLIDEQINSVRRELANMLNVGVIQSETKDNKLYYKINNNYKYLRPLTAIFVDNTNGSTKVAKTRGDTVLPWIRSIERLSGVQLAVIAGRLVSGSGSKIDLLLVGNISIKSANALVKKIEELEGGELNYTIMSYDNFYYRLSVRDQFIMDIIGGNHSILVDTEGVLRKEK